MWHTAAEVLEEREGVGHPPKWIVTVSVFLLIAKVHFSFQRDVAEQQYDLRTDVRMQSLESRRKTLHRALKLAFQETFSGLHDAFPGIIVVCLNKTTKKIVDMVEQFEAPFPLDEGDRIFRNTQLCLLYEVHCRK